MLPPENRLRLTRQHRLAMRQAVRVAGRFVIMHLSTPSISSATSSAMPARAGFVVDRAVGDAVTRNRVRRRLRHLMRGRLDRLAPGSLVLVRARPTAASASSDALAADLDLLLDRVLDRVLSPGRRRRRESATTSSSTSVGKRP